MSRQQKLANSRNQPLGVAPESTPRGQRGRTLAPETPVSIHASGIDLPKALNEYIHTKLGAKVGAFALQIERVAVRFTDLNGPRGGVDHECRIQVSLAGRPAIVVAERARETRAAFDAASQALGRAVKHDLERAGYTQGLRAARRNKRSAAPVAAPVEAPEAPAPAPARTQRKTKKYVASSQKLGQRARAQANSPKTRAAAAKARR